MVILLDYCVENFQGIIPCSPFLILPQFQHEPRNRWKFIVASINIQIVNPKAKSLLLNREKMNLIRIEAKPELLEILAKLRRNEAEVPAFEEIAEEVGIGETRTI
jgi:hypothetical protein